MSPKQLKLSLSILLVLLMFSHGGVSFAQEETPVTQEAPVVVSPAPVVVVDNDTAWIDGSLITWSGWVTAMIFAGLFVSTAQKLANNGNTSAAMGLQFFNAARDMLPLDKWQEAFEKKSKETTTPFDDIAAAGTRAFGEQTGLLNNPHVGESAVGETKPIS